MIELVNRFLVYLRNEKKIKSEEKAIEGNVDVDILEKEVKAKVSGDVEIIKAKGEEAVKLAEAESRKSKLDELKLKETESKIAELKEKLTQFDDMLAEGKISEDVYKIRINRVEKELKDLEHKL